MRRRFVSSKYSRQRGNPTGYDDTPTEEEIAALRKRRAEEDQARSLLLAAGIPKSRLPRRAFGGR